VSVQVSDDELADARRALRWFAKLSSLASLEAAGWHALKATEENEDKQRAAEARQTLREHFMNTRQAIEDAITCSCPANRRTIKRNSFGEEKRLQALLLIE